MIKHPETQRLESIANLLRELKRFAPAHDVNIAQAIYDLEAIAKDFDQRIDLHVAERPLINKVTQQDTRIAALEKAGAMMAECLLKNQQTAEEESDEWLRIKMYDFKDSKALSEWRKLTGGEQ